jgi:glycosyltransferase involved in cell wall biosynthesis
VLDLGLEHRVRLLGHWTRVPAQLRSLDIFVLASKFEPFGVAILEAKAAGVAIVATRVNEVPEILSDGESGLLTPPEDPDGMARALVMLATDPALRARLGRRARLEAEQRHSLDAVVDAYQQLYESCLN